jgi:hypothetical protein
MHLNREKAPKMWKGSTPLDHEESAAVRLELSFAVAWDLTSSRRNRWSRRLAAGAVGSFRACSLGEVT